MRILLDSYYSARKRMSSILMQFPLLRKPPWNFPPEAFICFLAECQVDQPIFLFLCPLEGSNAHTFFCFRILCQGQQATLGSMGICHMPYAKKYGQMGYPRKENKKIQLRDVIQRSLGHSNQKLWPKVDFGEFHHVYPLEHFRWVATRYLWVYKFEKIHEA